MDYDTRFWMVVLPGRAAPTQKHHTKGSAEDQALRLATKEGVPAYVMEAVSGCKPVAVVHFNMADKQEDA